MFSALRILFGLLFLASAILKLFPIEYFEVVLAGQVGISWHLVPWVSRLLIILELAIGLSLVFGFWLRTALLSSMLMIVAFSIHLGWQVMQGAEVENCGCFGELLPMDSTTSLVKNVVFLTIGGLLIRFVQRAKSWRFPLLAPILAALSIPLIFVILPLPNFDRNADFELDFELLNRQEFVGFSPMTQGDKLVIIMLADCVHCSQLASFISTIEPQKVQDGLRMLVAGSLEDYEAFVAINGIDKFAVQRTSDRELVAAIGGVFPTAILIEGGKVSGKWKGNEINITMLSELLNVH